MELCRFTFEKILAYHYFARDVSRMNYVLWENSSTAPNNVTLILDVLSYLGPVFELRIHRVAEEPKEIYSLVS